MARYKKFDEETIVIGFRVPKSKAPELKEMVQGYIDRYYANKRERK